jgi:hypothetical protein
LLAIIQQKSFSGVEQKIMSGAFTEMSARSFSQPANCGLQQEPAKPANAAPVYEPKGNY